MNKKSKSPKKENETKINKYACNNVILILFNRDALVAATYCYEKKMYNVRCLCIIVKRFQYFAISFNYVKPFLSRKLTYI